MAPIIKTTIQLLLSYVYSEDALSASRKSLTPDYDAIYHSTDETVLSGPSLSVISWGSQRMDIYGNDKASDEVSHKWWDGYQWNPSGPKLELLGGGSKLSAVSANTSLMDIFAIGKNGNLQQKFFDGHQWQPASGDWRSLTEDDGEEGPLDPNSAPAATSWAPGRLDVFAKGLENNLLLKYYDGSNWAPDGGELEDLGGNLFSAPVAVSWGPERNDVFVVDDDKLSVSHIYWDGSQWSKWERLSGDSEYNAAPGATTWGEGRLDVFAVNVDGKLIHLYYDGSQWSSEEDLSGSVTTKFEGTPAAISSKGNGNSNDRIDIVVLGVDKQYYYIYWDGSKWSDWSCHGGSFSSPPSIVSWEKNAAQRLDIFGVTSDSQLGHQTWWGQGWYPEWNQWETLGGDLQVSRTQYGHSYNEEL